MENIYKRSAGLTDVPTHYCPGCTHGIIHKLVAETLEELGVWRYSRSSSSRLCCFGL